MSTSRRKMPLLNLLDEVLGLATGEDYPPSFMGEEFDKAKKILEARILELAESLTYWHNKGTMGDLPCSGWDSNCGTCPVLANIERKEKGSE